MRVLITGVNGYIGSNLKKFLEAKGIEVVGFDLPKNVLDTTELAIAMAGCQYAFNCAAISSLKECDEQRMKAFRTNIQGAINVVEICNEVGAKPILFSSNPHATRLNYYGTLKRLLEYLFEDKAIILRLANVYGGVNFEKKNTVITHFMKDNPIRVLDPEQKRDFVHIGKVMEWCLKALTLPCGVYEVRSGYENTIENMALLAGTIRGVEVMYE